jgi:hypothetical protein
VGTEEDGGGQGHFILGHTSKVRKLLCSSGNNSLSGKLGDLSCSSTYRPEKRRSLFSCMSRVLQVNIIITYKFEKNKPLFIAR